MLAECRMYYTAIEQDLGGVGNVIECPESFFEFVVVIVPQGNYPRFYFLFKRGVSMRFDGGQRRNGRSYLLERHDLITSRSKMLANRL